MRPLAAVCLLIVALIGRSLAADSVRPTFVVVVSDDHTYCAVGYRNPQVYTPHFDELVSESLCSHVERCVKRTSRALVSTFFTIM
jgi:hypothetical protein